MASEQLPATALRVCQVLEGGFAMLNAGVADHAAVNSDAQLHGYDVDVRRAVLAGLPYSVRAFASYGEAFARTRAGECDIGWSTYFHTAARTQCEADQFLCRPLDAASASGDVADWAPYGCCVDFGVSVWPVEIGVLYADGNVSFYSAVFSMVTSPFFVNFLSFAFIWVVVIAHLVWLAERKQNATQFPARYLDGIDDAMWWALVTFTTVGYGDKVQETPTGRVLGIMWMIVGITMCGILTGHMATHFSDSIQHASKSIHELDFSGLRVCGQSGVFSSWFFPESLGYEEAVVADGLASCTEMLQNDEVDVAVAERPHLLWYDKTGAFDWEVAAGSPRISEAIAQVPAGVVYPKNSTRRDEIDLRFMRLHETPVLRDAQSRWFAVTTSNADDVVQWALVGPALGLVGLYLMLMIARQILQKDERAGRVAERMTRTMSTNGITRALSMSVQESDKQKFKNVDRSSSDDEQPEQSPL